MRLKFWSALFRVETLKIIWFWSTPNKFWPVRWKKAIICLVLVMSLSPDAASMQKKNILSCVSVKHECLQWWLSQTSPMKEEHLLSSCGKSGRAVCSKKNIILPFEPFKACSLRQPWEILCWVLHVRVISTRPEPSLTKKQILGGCREREQTYLRLMIGWFRCRGSFAFWLEAGTEETLGSFLAKAIPWTFVSHISL